MTDEKRIVNVSPRGVNLATWDDVRGFSRALVSSGMVPFGLLDKSGAEEKSVARVAIVIQSGMELGLGPMASLRGLYIVNNMPTVYGRVGIGLCQRTGRLEYVREWFEVDGKRVDVPTEDPSCTAVCEVKAKDMAESYFGRFSVQQAVQAKLWKRTGKNGKDTPWVTGPFEQLMWRARWRGYGVVFATELNGTPFYEEVRDYEPEEPRDADYTVKVAETADALADTLEARAAPEAVEAPESPPAESEDDPPRDDLFPENAQVGEFWKAPDGQEWLLTPDGWKEAPEDSFPW